jgi:hypothetical protein
VFFSWRTLITGRQPDAHELRHIILIDPVLDFTRPQPGKLPIDAIRSTASRLQVDTTHGVRVRLTGPVPLAASAGAPAPRQDHRPRHAASHPAAGKALRTAA